MNQSINNFKKWNMKACQISDKKSQLSKEISRFSKLRLHDVVATTFVKKVQMFKNSFFFSVKRWFERYKWFHICEVAKINKNHRQRRSKQSDRKVQNR